MNYLLTGILTLTQCVRVKTNSYSAFSSHQKFSLQGRSYEYVFCTLWMSQRCLLYVMNVLKMPFVRYGCLKDFFCTNKYLYYITLWMSQRPLLYVIIAQKYLLYVMNFSKKSFVCYKCLKHIFLFLFGCLKDVFCTLWMSQRWLLYIMDVSKTSFVRYDRLKMSFVCYKCLKDVFCTLWMSERSLKYT